MRGPTDRPNIILINCDDLGYGDVGCYGSKLNKTPRLDRMAAEGVRFTDFYMASSVCSPSRAAMMTGCYPRRVGLDWGEKFLVLLPGDAIGLSGEEVTIPEILKARGYATHMIGKWHIGDQAEFLPTRHGFDSYFGLPYSNDMYPRHPANERFKFPPLPLMKQEKVIEVEPVQEELTGRYLADALRFIRDNRDRPFFLYLAHMYVHWPYHPPAEFKARSTNGVYGAEVEHIDYCTGAMLDALAELGIDQNTLVMFTSDNGGVGHQWASNAPLRGTKGTTWEGGLRVPLIARWPGTIPAGQTCTELATAMDFLPTLAHLAGAGDGIPTDRIIDGRDVRPLLMCEPGARSPYEAFFYYAVDKSLAAVRAGRWKLHLESGELYDLQADVGETTNVADDNAEVAARLTALADACREDLGDGKLNIPGRNCRPPGRVENPVHLRLSGDDPLTQAAYD